MISSPPQTNLTLSSISDPNLTESIINSTHEYIIAGEEQLQQLDEDVVDAMYDSNEIKDMVFNENSVRVYIKTVYSYNYVFVHLIVILY